jgi:hypothetical protein
MFPLDRAERPLAVARPWGVKTLDQAPPPPSQSIARSRRAGWSPLKAGCKPHKPPKPLACAPPSRSPWKVGRIGRQVSARALRLRVLRAVSEGRVDPNVSKRSCGGSWSGPSHELIFRLGASRSRHRLRWRTAACCSSGVESGIRHAGASRAVIGLSIAELDKSFKLEQHVYRGQRAPTRLRMPRPYRYEDWTEWPWR